MLILSFFATVFISVLWLVYAGIYLSARFAETDFYTLGLNDAVLCAVFVLLPLLVLFGIWGRFCCLRHEMGLQKQFSLLSAQMRQNQEYSDIIARLLLKNSQLQSHAFAMGKIDLYIGEMNEILSDILRRYRLLDENGMREVWTTVKLGNRWGFAKAFVDLYNSEDNFGERLFSLAKEQTLLAGGLTEFCARYTRLLGLLKIHDEENILQDVIETGVFGRVFAVFAPVVRSLNEKEPEQKAVPFSEAMPDPVVLKDEERFFKDEDDEDYDDESELFDMLTPEENKQNDIADNEPEKNKKPFWSRLLGLREDDEDAPKRPDPLTIALERSFGTPDEPKFEEKSSEQEPESPKIADVSATETEPSEVAVSEEMPTVSENNNAAAEVKPDNAVQTEPAKRPLSKRFAFANTDKTIKSLQKEWEEMKKNDKAAVDAKKAEE
uniref:Uncharacterized protein n=1 Tax=uncultured Alphaproteobacteria bacterium TaxID=91750 RepID=A0A6M4NNA6_9PROT|nr:hypothetical protein PlAlph_1460 [uncultured Alphaproteobacteria bacterium]